MVTPPPPGHLCQCLTNIQNVFTSQNKPLLLKESLVLYTFNNPPLISLGTSSLGFVGGCSEHCSTGSSRIFVQTDLTLADIGDSRQTALSGNRKLSLHVQDVFFVCVCVELLVRANKVEADGTQHIHLSGKAKSLSGVPILAP